MPLQLGMIYTPHTLQILVCQLLQQAARHPIRARKVGHWVEHVLLGGDTTLYHPNPSGGAKVMHVASCDADLGKWSGG